MTIHWGALLAVFAVSLGSTIAVVGLVTLALRGLSPAAEERGGFLRRRSCGSGLVRGWSRTGVGGANFVASQFRSAATAPSRRAKAEGSS